MTHPDGTVEQGCFQNHMLNGQGVRTQPNGVVIQGQFKDGVIVERN